jgi:hypothetical protein
MRDELKVKRSAPTDSRALSSAGISVSMVTLELGTICPMRSCRMLRLPFEVLNANYLLE